MFGGFKASINVLSGNRQNKKNKSELTADMCVSGAYRTNREDLFGYSSIDQPKRPATSEQVFPQIRPTKSTDDLSRPKTVQNLRNSTPNVSRNPRGSEQYDQNGALNRKDLKNQEKERKKIEKQRVAEQKAREKQEAQEQAKQEKLRKEREKREAQQAKKEAEQAKKEAEQAKKAEQQTKKRTVKMQAPQPQAATAQSANPIAQNANRIAQSGQSSTQYSTNTLESSISKTSGPPPYSDVPIPPEITTEPSKTNKDVRYNKPADEGSWDMISQHRQQIIRPTANVGGGSKQGKQLVMDLNYNNLGGSSQPRDNSDA